MQPAAKAPEAGSAAAYAAAGGMGGVTAENGGSGGSVDPRQSQLDPHQPGDDRGGSGGMVAPLPTGGMVAGNTGEEVHPVPQPQAGVGGMPKPETGGDGAPAMPPAERVLWSQTWTVELHGTDVRSSTEGDQMGLRLQAGEGCVFGDSPTASGATQVWPFGTCSTEHMATASTSIRVWSGKTPVATRSVADLTGWTEAVTGHTVLYLRRSQTYELYLLSNGEWSYDYADFTGTWEAVGY